MRLRGIGAGTIGRSIPAWFLFLLQHNLPRYPVRIVEAPAVDDFMVSVWSSRFREASSK